MSLRHVHFHCTPPGLPRTSMVNICVRAGSHMGSSEHTSSYAGRIGRRPAANWAAAAVGVGFVSPLACGAGSGLRVGASRGAFCRRPDVLNPVQAARRPRHGSRIVVPVACATIRVLQDTLVAIDDVDVTLRVEDLGGRRRRISGGVNIDAPVSRVWHVLTQYALMDKYMPNITKSVLEIKNGELFLDQIGIISRKLGLTTRMVMRVTEKPIDVIAFSRISGRDFSEFEGRYFFKQESDGLTRLDYEVVAVPMPLFPVSLVERKIVKEVPGMLASVRGEAMFGRVIPL